MIYLPSWTCACINNHKNILPSRLPDYFFTPEWFFLNLSGLLWYKCAEWLPFRSYRITSFAYQDPKKEECILSLLGQSTSDRQNVFGHMQCITFILLLKVAEIKCTVMLIVFMEFNFLLKVQTINFRICYKLLSFQIQCFKTQFIRKGKVPSLIWCQLFPNIIFVLFWNIFSELHMEAREITLGTIWEQWRL